MIGTYYITGEWWGRLEEVVEDIEEKGFEVVEYNSEWITFVDPDGDDDKSYMAYLGGIGRTIYIERIEEV